MSEKFGLIERANKEAIFIKLDDALLLSEGLDSVHSLAMAVQDDLAVNLCSGDDQKLSKVKMIIWATPCVITYRIRDGKYKQEQVSSNICLRI